MPQRDMRNLLKISTGPLKAVLTTHNLAGSTFGLITSVQAPARIGQVAAKSIW
jgi:hypothetical protein